ncbi:hypothetical protein [Vibrio sp. D431a]|uniref:hypothetical protein n=1 Tax=Vibrio sp. D431a TaxID=2837388 RepID=UPI002557106C|nr:hypothetical protein [Vibrio sp. D431a]MDK9793688.1 hypothetical protein [Vibrio sp. D431a]
MKFLDAWHFLSSHKIFNVQFKTEIPKSQLLQECLKTKGLGVDFLSSRVSHFPDKVLSVVVMEDVDGITPVIALECGEVFLNEDGELDSYHNVELDVYAPTYELAVCALASKVKEQFGEDLKGSQLVVDLRR